MKRKTQRDEALETASVESLEAELRKIEDAKRLGVASNEKVQRVKALEDAIARQREQRKSEAAAGAAAAPAPRPRVEDIE